MNPRTLSVRSPRRRDRGFALVPAVFLVVVLGGLAAFAARLHAQQEQTVALAALGARALSAANAGVEWGAWRALRGGCANGTLELAEGALAGFRVVVTCTAGSIPDGGATLATYAIEAVASTGSYGQAGYVRRRVRAMFVEAT